MRFSSVPPDLFFAINAVIVAIVVWQAWHFLRQRGQKSFFREDLWGELERTDPQLKVPRPQDFMSPEELVLLMDESSANARMHGNEEATDPAIKRPKPKGKRPKQKASAPYALPKFNGEPHEVLGISANADLKTVEKAYKYWVRRFHPDRVQHLGPGYVKQANIRTEQLNLAKERLSKLKKG